MAQDLKQIKPENHPSLLLMFVIELQHLTGVNQDENEQEMPQRLTHYVVSNFGELPELDFDFSVHSKVLFCIKTQLTFFIELSDEEFLKRLYTSFSGFLTFLMNNK